LGPTSSDQFVGGQRRGDRIHPVRIENALQRKLGQTPRNVAPIAERADRLREHLHVREMAAAAGASHCAKKINHLQVEETRQNPQTQVGATSGAT
jgi:hypothetical protein